MSFKEKWWPTAYSLGISRDAWERIATSERADATPRLPLASVGWKPQCTLHDDIWKRIADTLHPHTHDQEAINAPQFAQAVPQKAWQKEIFFNTVGMTIRDRVAELLEWFELERGSSVDIKKFRKSLKDRLSAIHGLLDVLPPSGGEGTFFVRDQFTVTDDALKEIWANKVGNDPLRLSLAIHAEAVSRALDRLPARRPPEAAIDNLVFGLARIWTDVTGSPPLGSVRMDGKSSFEGGPFADFVRAVVAELPLPHPSLDRPIRAAREAYGRNKIKSIENRP